MYIHALTPDVKICHHLHTFRVVPRFLSFSVPHTPTQPTNGPLQFEISLSAAYHNQIHKSFFKNVSQCSTYINCQSQNECLCLRL